jgi:Fe-S-cluster containining protein
MTSRRAQLLHTMYQVFDQWAAPFARNWACGSGCAVCCTQNVTMTAVEGDRIHQFIREAGCQAWFVGRLTTVAPRGPAVETTNEFAGRCLAGLEGDEPEEAHATTVCPFLAEGLCRIYAVRPFACRSFASQTTCQPGQAAQLPPAYISAATAAQQLIEHVGQGEYWGNMHDVLLALCDLPENAACGDLLPPTLVAQARARLRKARPLPGFLIGPEEYEKVSGFITALFKTNIDGKTVEDILNGTQAL